MNGKEFHKTFPTSDVRIILFNIKKQYRLDIMHIRITLSTFNIFKNYLQYGKLLVSERRELDEHNSRGLARKREKIKMSNEVKAEYGI